MKVHLTIEADDGNGGTDTCIVTVTIAPRNGSTFPASPWRRPTLTATCS